MSALPPKADIRQRIEHVCFVPEADVTPIGPRAAHQHPQAAIRSQHRRAARDDRTAVLVCDSTRPRATSIAGMSAHQLGFQ